MNVAVVISLHVRARVCTSPAHLNAHVNSIDTVVVVVEHKRGFIELLWFLIYPIMNSTNPTTDIP